MAILRTLLFPFAILYDAITRVRNHLYTIGHKKSFRFDTTVISVGNLAVGGSGKTPMIEYLVRLLLSRYALATLSRGYGRKTKGLRFATTSDSAATLGDEPFQFFRKFGTNVLVTVGEDRVFAIPHILHRVPETRAVLLDDAFQHRAVDPQLSILLTDYRRPFYTDWVMPAGNLREARHGAGRCDAVVVTRSPEDLSSADCDEIAQSVRRYAPGKPVFFSSLQYELPVGFGIRQPVSSDVVLVSGIANAESLVAYVKSKFNLVHHFLYRDHHVYTAKELNAIHEFCRVQASPVTLLTTEKDMVKLIDPRFSTLIGSMPWFYLPIKIAFLNYGSDFDTFVLQTMNQTNQNR